SPRIRVTLAVAQVMAAMGETVLPARPVAIPTAWLFRPLNREAAAAAAPLPAAITRVGRAADVCRLQSMAACRSMGPYRQMERAAQGPAAAAPVAVFPSR